MITTYVTHPEQILRILMGINWPVKAPELDSLYEFAVERASQLLPNTHNCFPELEVQLSYDAGQDPPHVIEIDPLHWEMRSTSWGKLIKFIDNYVEFINFTTPH